MAGDWIKVRTDLRDDPAVVEIAASLEISEQHAVGCLACLWSWADGQTRDGNARGVTGKWIDRLVGVPRFSDALVAVGWLAVHEVGISIPKFDRHMSQSAKSRALTAKRVAVHRGGKCNAIRVTESLPEKRREEKIERKDLMPRTEPEAAVVAALPKRKRPKPPPDPTAIELANFHAKAVRNWKADARINPTSARSLDGFAHMVRIDGRHPDRIRELLRFLFGGERDDYQGTAKFDWRPVLLSGETLREHWDQIESLYENRIQENGNGHGRR